MCIYYTAFRFVMTYTVYVIIVITIQCNVYLIYGNVSTTLYMALRIRRHWNVTEMYATVTVKILFYYKNMIFKRIGVIFYRLYFLSLLNSKNGWSLLIYRLQPTPVVRNIILVCIQNKFVRFR